MQSLRKEDWRYAFLLVLLLAIASLATQALINYILPLLSSPRERIVVTLLVCTLSFGLMLISGAFGLWVIKFEATSASIRSLGNLVSSMSYIKDGIISLNKKGLTTGMNPAARKLLNVKGNRRYKLSELCPNLSNKEINLLYKSSNPEELESKLEFAGQAYSLRFRSQPSKDSRLILLNDVSKLSNTRTRRRHAAYLQLIGHISQGVANDFNNLLCGISGHASLITHTPSDKTLIEKSASAITDSANRGIQLAGHLLELSNSNNGAQSATIQPSTTVKLAIEGLASNLHSSWKIISDINSDVEPTNMTTSQIEQIIHGLGMLAADSYNKTRTITIQLMKPAATGLAHLNGDYSCIIIITPTRMSEIDHGSLRARDDDSVGTIESVVTSILKQSGGNLDCFISLSGIPLYRICLPHASTDQIRTQQETLPLGLEAYISNWHLLLCKDKNPYKKIKSYMDSCNVNVEYSNSIIDTLSRIEHGSDLNAIVINSETLGPEHEGLLRAIIKLCPQAGLVVINKTETTNQSGSTDVVFVPRTHSPAQIAQAMIEARTLARARQKQDT